eukprot:5429586-Prymnesium_polylepis.1
MLAGLSAIHHYVLLGPLSATATPLAARVAPGGLSATLGVIANGPVFLIEALQVRRWHDGAMARWRDGAMARWRDG